LDGVTPRTGACVVELGKCDLIVLFQTDNETDRFSHWWGMEAGYSRQQLPQGAPAFRRP